MTSVNELNAKKQERERLLSKVLKLDVITADGQMFVKRDHVINIFASGEYITTAGDTATFSNTMPRMIQIKIAGKIPVKKNSYLTNGRGGMYKPRDVTDYEELVAWHCLKHKGAITGTFGIRGTFKLIKRKDIDGVLTTLLDCLERCGVIRNDNDLMEIGGLQKIAIKPSEEECVEFELYTLEQ